MTVPIFLFSMLRAGMLHARFAIRIVVLSSLVIVAVSLWSMEAFDSLAYRRQSSTDVTERIEGMVRGPATFAAEAGFLGYGAGATHQAASAIVPEAGFYTWLPTTSFEDEPARIMLELGIVGFVAAFALRIYLCVLAWRAMLAGGTRAEKGLAGGALIFFVAHLTSPIVFNPTGGALYWLFAGILATILRDQYLRGRASPHVHALVPERS
jgi:hypothetical protein